MEVVLISTYELGRQPFGLASPVAWLQEAEANVTCLDLAVEKLDMEVVAAAQLIAFYLPMHTATRISIPVVQQVKSINPRAHLCFYGLYAPVNEGFLRKLGADTILGGEFEEGLLSLYKRLANPQSETATQEQPEPLISLARQQFLVPDREKLPSLSRYAHLAIGDGQHRIVGYTEATRGCKHRCRHCPIVPVYNGHFRIVQRDVVLADIRQQVAAGATHICFGDPDFFNGPGHAIPIVNALHKEFPEITYDVTIKIQHLVKHARHLPTLGDTGCLFITSAVEAIDEYILEIFDKNHTREDFIRATELCREVSITFNPTFVTFTPWTSLKGYLELLELLMELDLVDNVAPIQYAIRLLIPTGSRLLELPETQEIIGEFDEESLCYQWTHPDPEVDRLHQEILQIVHTSQRRGESRREIFAKVWRRAHQAYARSVQQDVLLPELQQSGLPKAPVPQMTEAWFC
jgi:radical SAM superfamily enzyme YgiQ (UPF0313 family)